ncbi:patatin [Apibacter muscae]|uniref:patatin-like phospholipase family protein n=1 Tax=Apibacter muscae TaxID=2509004 RepID=UPI0011ABBC96|nr:patatin-like phospholipase family protein [Apibacter muscae]TWP24888.1 patatin [Apibacter muscae]
MEYSKKYIIFLVLIISHLSFAQVNESISNINIDSLNRKPKVGLVLSGGGAKGFAHIEVLEAIEKAGIRIDYISGTSMGAIVGSLYAAGYSPNEIKYAIESVDFTELFIQNKERDYIPFFNKSYGEKHIISLPLKNFKLTFPSAISDGQGPLLLLTKLLYNVHDVKDYSHLPIPFLCIATDLETGEEIQMESGFLPLSVLASGAYPSLLEPVKINGKILVDGGIVNNFPAKALKDKGMDIVIGVDLGSGLQSAKEINSILNIINQIVSYRINLKTDYERDFVDLLIKPDLKDFSVTDFDKKDSILAKGKIIADKYFPQLKKIAELQNYDSLSRPRIKELPEDKYLFITNFSIEGNSSDDSIFIKRKIGLHTPMNSSITKLNQGVSNLYSTGNYNQVYYKIKYDSTKNSQKITLHLDEKSNNFLKLGLHYDDVYKASLLTNITLNKLFLKNSTLSLDVIFSNNFRTNLNYYIDNGILPSFGLNTSYTNFNFNYSDIKNDEYPFDRIRNFNQQIYIQSTLMEKYALGAGLEYNYIYTLPFYLNNIDYKKDENYFFNTYLYLKADTQDNANFPSRGFKLDVSTRFNLFSNAEKERFTMLKGDLNFAIPITKRLFIENQLFLGVSFESPSLQYKYYLGGYFKQDFNNFKSFLGLPFGYVFNDQILTLYSSLNYRLFKNHYLKTYVNLANLENDFDNINYFKYKYTSFGIGYGYDSPFGPINLMYSYSVNQNKGVLSVGLGYWF